MLAIIIFGTRGVRSTLKQGSFYCPQCDCEKDYKHKKVTRFFTLYFIPVIPLGKIGEYVECYSCRNTYIPRIIDMQSQIIEIQENNTNETNQISSPSTQIGAVVAIAPATSTPIENEQIIKPVSEDTKPLKNLAIKKILIMMILADGKVENSEIQMFHKVYKESTGEYVVDIYKEINEVQSENKQPYHYLKEIVNVLNDEGKEAIIKASMMIAASDGDIDISEINMVENFGKALEMKTARVNEIIESIKKII